MSCRALYDVARYGSYHVSCNNDVLVHVRSDEMTILLINQFYLSVRVKEEDLVN